MGNLNLESRPQIFDAELLGLSFRKLAVDIVRGETTDFMSRWYRSAKSDADLVIWTDSEKRIIKHQLSMFGQIVEWNPISGTRTGLVVEEELVADAEGGRAVDIDSGAEAGTSESIRFDQRVQEDVVQRAIRVLSSIPDLDESDRSALVFNLRESPRMHARARERALKAWAPKAAEINSTRRPAFWNRLKKWVCGT